MWLVGVVVRRYIDILKIIITFPYSTCITSSFFCSSIPTSLFILKMFFGSLTWITSKYTCISTSVTNCNPVKTAVNKLFMYLPCRKMFCVERCSILTQLLKQLCILNYRNTWTILITKQAKFPPRTSKSKLHACACPELIQYFKCRLKSETNLVQ